MAKYFGFDLEAKCISFSGFSSQGDGASFTGTCRLTESPLAAIKLHVPEDEELIPLAERLTVELVKAKLFGAEGLQFGITRSGRYEHSRTMSLAECAWLIPYDMNEEEAGLDEDELLSISRDLADWLYDRLEQEYEYLMSDEVVDQYLNDDTSTRYDADGARI